MSASTRSLPSRTVPTRGSVLYTGSFTQAVLPKKAHQMIAIHAGDARGLRGVLAAARDQRFEVTSLEDFERGVARVAIRGELAFDDPARVARREGLRLYSRILEANF